ncbi:MAG: Formylglycine-rating enzyme family protein [Candidatus Hydrogenedentes bacterium]|nr:Formylglycine-rating enzyme family protein [Candidatus Hydrogenedentota bacterium]
MTRPGNRIVWCATLVLIAGLTGCGKTSAPVSSGETNTAAPAQSAEVTTPSGVAMILLPGGDFLMGCDGGHEDETPVHPVTLTGFAIDKYEVTQDQLAALQEPDPSHFKAPRRPVEQVRWSDAALICNLRARADGLEPCYDETTFACNFAATGYRLPTEAEWEYAARAGTGTDYDFGNDPADLKKYACYADTSRNGTDEVGKKKPNGFGLHDMYGNVCEWCNDVYDPLYYAQGIPVDPHGPGEGDKRVMRGGAWNSGAEACRAAMRYAEAPGISDACFARDTFGFRCVRRLTPEEEAQMETPKH